MTVRRNKALSRHYHRPVFTLHQNGVSVNFSHIETNDNKIFLKLSFITTVVVDATRGIAKMFLDKLSKAQQ